jgi:putative restriction endonuclease
VTDFDWFNFLKKLQPEDINFWQPSGRHFTAIEKGEPFLFKLKAPYNAIGGVGFFSAYAAMSIAVAWEFFKERNGVASFRDLRLKIEKYRNRQYAGPDPTMTIGCIILTDPVFFQQEEWIPQPEDWSAPIMTGKTYDDTSFIGAKLWDEVRIRLAARRFYDRNDAIPNQFIIDPIGNEYRETVSRVRIGQGAFRVLVAEAYGRACAVTGDHTLPALEAAHIRSFAESGPHLVSNGLLLRSDLHNLFDAGYVTVTEDYHFEVSPAIKEDYNNGKVYYLLQGKKLAIPESPQDQPKPEFLRWHNDNVYRAS